jgi:hypothetical protein
VREVTVLYPLAGPASARSEITCCFLTLSEKVGVPPDIAKQSINSLGLAAAGDRNRAETVR